jgi:hypothetical protein
MALAEIVVPVGVAAAAGITLAATISPRWRAAGAPYFQGCGKNVESAAVAGALAAGAATQWFVSSRRGLAACSLVAALGLALVAHLSPVALLVAGWPQLLAIAGLVTALGIGRRGSALAATRTPAASESGSADVPILAAALLVGALASAAFAVTVGPPMLSIDTYHHGEVLSTALDLLRGGRPFKTLIWPHGLHDTGLAALWMLATGKIGTSPVALAWASCCGLGVIAAYVAARRLLGSRGEALAVCLVAALAPLLSAQPQTGAGAWALYQLGELFFVVIGFAVLTSRRRRDLAAGLCFGLAYLFRIETGLYGSLAALAVIAHRDLVAAGEPFAKAVKTAAGSVLRFLAGAALLLGGSRLVVGWPGAEWFSYTLWELPRLHRDATGIALPWPRRGVELSPGETAWLSAALARLLLVLLLLVQAMREVLGRWPARPLTTPRLAPPSPPSPSSPSSPPGAGSERAAQLLFMALFAAVATKTALDRSDLSHVLQWSALPLLAAACLALAGWRERQSWGRWRSAAAVLVLAALLDFGSLGFQIPTPRGAAELASLVGERWHALVEHLAPSPPIGGCADRTFTPGESRLAANRDFIAATCAMEALLRSHGVSRLVVADSASWYYVRFRLPMPTRYFAMARAYTPPRQLELIRELRASRPQALLLVHGYGAIAAFDVPDAVRVPVVDAYLRGRRRGVAVTPTPLGDLFFWDEPGERVPAAPSGGAGPRTAVAAVAADLVAVQPASGLLFAQGWASGGAAQRPPAALALCNPPPGATADFDVGLRRDDLPEPLRHAGWELRVRGWPAPAGVPGAGPGAGPRLALDVDALAADGSVDRVKLELPAAHVLGPLSGDEWKGLREAVDRAAAMGRADRAAALAAAAGPAPRSPLCQPPRASAGDRR